MCRFVSTFIRLLWQHPFAPFCAVVADHMVVRVSSIGFGLGRQGVPVPWPQTAFASAFRCCCFLVQTDALRPSSLSCLRPLSSNRRTLCACLVVVCWYRMVCCGRCSCYSPSCAPQQQQSQCLLDLPWILCWDIADSFLYRRVWALFGLVRARCWCDRLAGNCWCSLLVAVVCCVWGVCITVLCAPLVCSRRCFMVLAMAPRLLASHAAFCAPSCRHGCSSRCGSFCVGVQRCGLSQLSRVVLSSVCGRLLCVPVAVSSQQAGSPWVVVWLPGHQCDFMVFWTCGGCVVSQIVMDQHRRAGQHCRAHVASLLVCTCGAKVWRCNKLSWLGAMHGLTRSCIC